ncbi:DUF4124 domain-containing protein [Azonexus sp. IMCC34842]|uniref:DUF4124 domain-containing protein n=1 Tax=Azonexus sp. IMCC34842 TaxID=3420950 RepID=UPI003D0A13E0
MRYLLGVLLLLCVSTVSAEAFRCVGSGGEIVFSDTPCDDGERFSKIRPSESTQDSEAARRALDKQKAYAERLAAENEAARRSKAGASSLPDESSPPPASPAGLSFPGSSSGSGGGSASDSSDGVPRGGSTGGVPRGVPSAPSRK